jgi:hypothetical protein
VLIPCDEGTPEPCMLIDSSRLDIRELVHVIGILDEVVNSGGCKALANKLGIVLPEL